MNTSRHHDFTLPPIRSPMDKIKPLRIIVMASGEGTTFTAIHKAIQCGVLNAEIVCMISNFSDSGAVKYATENNIKHCVEEWNRENLSRSQYDTQLTSTVHQYPHDLIVLAGWMHVLSHSFTGIFKNTINLHPALPGSFVGVDCIEKAYNAFKTGKIRETGSMVHYVTEELDRGEVVESITIPIYQTDSLQDMTVRVKSYEKGLMISAIQKIIAKHNFTHVELLKKQVYAGKVRNVYDIGFDCLLLEATDRASAFDRHICDVPNKGNLLNDMSAWWFNNTEHIVPNHFLYSQGKYSVVRKCTPFKIEVVVRGYITGSTSTSLWTHYKNGSRNYSGNILPEGLIQHQKLEKPIITPTTKDVEDKPISAEDIVKEGFMSADERDFVFDRAMKLFTHGQQVASKAGLILVDTKYEFGKTSDGRIVLIDELHTCDSSRYWVESSYDGRMSEGKSPEKLDKDQIRDWVKSQCDPYKDTIPQIPTDVIQRVSDCYEKYYNMLTGSIEKYATDNPSAETVFDTYFNEHHHQICVILSGSVKDEKHVNKLKDELRKQNIYSVSYVSSAHKNTAEVLGILQEYNDFKNKNIQTGTRKIVWITVAGRSNALSGVVSANTPYPVIACPPFGDKVDMMVNINSTLQCPSKVPVLTVLEPSNVALCVSKMFDL